MNEYLEIRNFFNEPDIIRDIALDCNYDKCNFLNKSGGVWSGFRCEITHQSIYNYVRSKIEYHTKQKIERVSLNFHINPKISCLGSPHRDSKREKGFAGVIYLNKNLPDDKDYGTTLYEDSENENILNISDIQIMYSVDLPLWNNHKVSVKNKLIDFKNSLSIKQKIKNEYNKMILYNSNIYHAPDYYFGDNIDDSRMTIAIHGVFE